MPVLTPEQQALKQAAQRMLECRSSLEADGLELRYRALANPAAVGALLAQIEAMHGCPKQTPYGEAICGACMEASERDKAS